MNHNTYSNYDHIPTPRNIIVKSTYKITASYFLPPNYIKETISEIMTYIFQTNPIYYEHLEIEAKLGCFDFIGNSIKCFNSINEGFRLPDYSSETKNFAYKFNPGLSPDKFYLIWSAVDKESLNPKSEIQNLGCHIYDESHYKSDKRKAMIYSSGKAPREEIIRKEDKKHINIRRNGYDFRVTCCKEMPSEINEGNDIVKMTRQKFRTSYRFSFYRIDFTIAQSSYDKGRLTYEIEIEIENESIQKLLNESDNDQLYTIIERFIQNVINLYTSTTLEGFNFTRKGSKYGSKYGSYLDNIKKEDNK